MWIAAVVAAHFVPLAAVLGDRRYIPLGCVVGVVAFTGMLVGLTGDGHTYPDTVVGGSTGVAMLLFVLSNLFQRG